MPTMEGAGGLEDSWKPPEGCLYAGLRTDSAKLAQRQVVAGALIFLGTGLFLMGMLVAESPYPGYSVSQNYISDLGATCRQTCVIVQPSSSIFDASVSGMGALLLAGAFLMWSLLDAHPVAILLAVTGIGAMGVGLFPETTGILHPLTSLVAFAGAGLTAIASYRLSKPLLSYLAVVLGGMTLLALVLYAFNIYLGMGPGGMERMIAYPVVIWGLGFGGLLASGVSESRSPPS
jgi:hypothetical membrane protein